MSKGWRETPATTRPQPTPPVMPRQNGKSRTYILWILEYLKAKHHEDKDAINAVIEVAMKEL